MESTLESRIQVISGERGISLPILRAALGDFLQALHEAQYKSGYDARQMGTIAQAYWSLGAEAAYHFVGVLANSGSGHDADTVCTVLELLDASAKRYGTTVDRWEFEVRSESDSR